jgi:hypothetical protein
MMSAAMTAPGAGAQVNRQRMVRRGDLWLATHAATFQPSLQLVDGRSVEVCDEVAAVHCNQANCKMTRGI